jgi:tetratricopeptide (TPR) repeat protein
MEASLKNTPAGGRTAARPTAAPGGSAPISTDYYLHSLLLLLGRVGNRILEFYNGFFSLGNGDNGRIYENLGRGFRNKGQFDKALAAYRELAKLNPGSADAQFQIGRLHAAKGELDLAIAAFRSAVAKKPDHAEARYHLGRACAKSQDLAGAVAELAKAVEQNPENHEWHYWLGVCHDKNGSPEKALVSLQRAVGLRPDEPRYHQYIGFVYEGLDRHDRAVEHFKAVMELESAMEDDL